MIDDILHLYSESPVQSSNGQCIIPSNNRYKIIWDILVLILVLVVSIIVPTRLAFATSEPLAWVIFYAVTDGIFFIDIIVTFFTSVSDKQRVYEVTEHRKIAIKYLKGWFWIDFVSILPLDLLIWREEQEATVLARFARIGKLYKLIRMVRLAKVLKLLKSKK